MEMLQFKLGNALRSWSDGWIRDTATARSSPGTLQGSSPNICTKKNTAYRIFLHLYFFSNVN